MTEQKSHLPSQVCFKAEAEVLEHFTCFLIYWIIVYFPSITWKMLANLIEASAVGLIGSTRIPVFRQKLYDSMHLLLKRANQDHHTHCDEITRIHIRLIKTNCNDSTFFGGTAPDRVAAISFYMYIDWFASWRANAHRLFSFSAHDRSLAHSNKKSTMDSSNIVFTYAANQLQTQHTNKIMCSNHHSQRFQDMLQLGRNECLSNFVFFFLGFPDIVDCYSYYGWLLGLCVCLCCITAYAVDGC